MIKMGFARRVTAIVANLSLLLNSFLPFLLAIQPVYAQSPEVDVPAIVEVIDNEPVEEPTPSPAPANNESPTPEPENPEPVEVINAEPVEAPTPTQFNGELVEVTPTPVNSEIGSLNPVVENTPTPEITPEVEQVCLEENQTIINSTNDLWTINDTDKISETKEKVKLGIRYIYPQDNKVSVVFKCLPKDETLRTSLKIQQVKTSELNLPDEIGNIGEFAYDITTSMTDGTFTYDVTLPKTSDTNAEISYIEKSLDDAKINEIKVDEIKPIEESKTEQSSDTVKAVSIDHFTIFVIVENPNPAWTQTINWQPYTTMEGEVVNDYEDGVFGLNDPSNGGTNVSPKGIDLASGANNSGINPGNEATLEYYYDTNNNSPNCQDDSLYLRMRLAGDPRGGGGIYDSYHWDFLVGDPANQNSSKYVIDIFGGKASNSYVENTADGGTIGVYENDLNSTTYTPNTGIVWSRRADNTQNVYTRLQEITYNNGTKQYWIEGYLPLSTFNSNQKQINFRDYLCQAATNANGFKDRFFASTSASNTDPLQKDWMDATAFFTKFSKNKSVANITNPGAITEINPAKTGDILVYTLTVKNDGSRIIPGFSIEDEIADILEYALIIDGDYDNNGKTGALLNTKIIWPAQDIPIGGSLVEKFSVQIKPTNQWTGTDFVMSNVYGDTTTVDIVKSADLTIVKKVVNDNGGTATIDDFEIKLNSNILSFDSGLVDETTTTYTATPSVSVNTSYLLSENDLPDYTEGNWSCKDVVGAVVAHNPLILLPGQDITCTITNDDRPASIIIEKQTFPDGSSQSFEFNPSWSETNFNLSDGQSNNSGSLVPGTYSVTEIIPEDWDLTSAVCSDQSSVDSISLQLGETVTCTFTNTQKGSISGYKWDDSDGSAATLLDRVVVPSWSVELWQGNNYLQTTTTGSDGKYEFTNLLPGVYQVKETTTGDWFNVEAITLDVTLVAGENDLNNDFVNAQYATVTVYKNVDTDGDGDIDITGASDWTWDITGKDNNATGTTVSILKPGTYTISEDQKSGYHVTSLVCNNGLASPENYGAVTSQEVILVSGQEFICTFTNTRDTGNLKVQKIVDDGSDLTNWSFSLDGGQYITADSRGYVEFGNIPTGFHSITESGPNGYSLFSIYGDCNENSNIDGQADITVDKNNNEICTFTNKINKGTITIIKDATPNDPQDFSFTTTGTGLSNFSLDDDSDDTLSNIKVFSNLFPGIYFITENNISGWDLTGLVCNDPDSGTVVNGSTSTIDLDPGETITCTFTNTKRGKIIIEKQTLPDGSLQSFEFNPSWSDSNFNLTDGQQHDSGWLVSGTYSISETAIQGWDLTNSVCSDQSPINAISLQDGEVITCVFRNTKIPTLTVTKYVVPSNDSGLFNLLIDGNQVGTNVGDSYTTNTLSVDIGYNHSVTETAGTNTNLDDYIAVYGGDCDPTGHIILTAGEDKNCTITNTRKTLPLYVSKFEDLNNNQINDSEERFLDGWTMELYDNETCTGTPLRSLITDSVTSFPGTAKFENLYQGKKYWVKEVEKTGWTLTTGNCRGYTIHNDINSNNRLYFGNQPNGTIHGYKWSDLDNSGTLNGEESLLSGWTINLYKSNKDGGFELSPFKTMATNNGQTHFGWYWFENLLPGKYKVCEVNQTGWDQTYPINNDSNCHIVNLPDDNSNAFPVSQNYVSGPEYNFGNRQHAQVTVYKFHDLNANGTREDNEPFLSDWEITMTPNRETNSVNQLTNGDGNTIYSLSPGQYTLGETIKKDWYQSNIYCEDSNPGVLITSPGEAYGHHGQCAGWNGCGDAATCALWACEAKGYSQLVSYGESRPCTQFNMCHLFNYRGSVQYNWGNWCNVMGVTNIKCSNGNNSNLTPTPTQTPNRSASPFVSGNTLNLKPGQNKTCYIGNYQKASVTVTKDVLDHLGQPLEDNHQFTVSTPGVGETNFSENSPAVYVLNPGTYTLSEINIDASYQLKSANNVVVTVTSGQNKSVQFINWNIPPKLTISKFNNVTSNLSPGGMVEYTIDLGIAQNDIKNLKVTDLLSNGFKYKTGSYKIYLDSVDVTFKVAEPQYHSPGVWDLSSLGTLTPENKLRLVYTADISTDQQPGKYTDLAWAAANYAYNDSEKLLALAEDIGKVDTNFVGTIVPIVKNTQNSVSAEVEQKVEGQVLGASTELPGTGASTLWLILSSILGFVGLGVLKINKKNMLTLLFALLSFGLIVKPALAADFVLSIQEPKTPSNTKDLKLEFKALHLNNGIITAKCLKKGPNDSGFSQFGSNIVLAAGGNSSYCDLSLAINDNGSYQFLVEANDSVDTLSKTVSLDYNTSTPGTPRDYRKDVINSCDVKIHFKTDADSGKTVKVELYRSTDSAFSANNDSLVHSVNIGSDQEYDIYNSVPDCSKTYYYALRAFDNAGNGSGLVGDRITVTTSTTTTTNETAAGQTGQGTGAIPVIGADIPSEEVPATTQEGEEEATLGGETGQVLGTEQGKLGNFITEHKVISGLIALAILGIIIYAIKKNRKNKKR